MQKIITFLWFDNQAEEAAKFYISNFKNSKILSTLPGPGGKPMSVTFELDGEKFTALNGGPLFKFTEAISLFVNCKSQEQVDNFWEKLSSGGEKGKCGWLKDKYGLSWQIVPMILGEMLADKDPEKANRVMQTMLKMTKIEIEQLKQAYENKT